MSTREYKLNKIKELGFKIRTLGKSLTESKCICATKDGEEHRGSVCKVFKKLFGYCQLNFLRFHVDRQIFAHLVGQSGLNRKKKAILPYLFKSIALCSIKRISQDDNRVLSCKILSQMRENLCLIGSYITFLIFLFAIIFSLFLFTTIAQQLAYIFESHLGYISNEIAKLLTL